MAIDDDGYILTHTLLHHRHLSIIIITCFLFLELFFFFGSNGFNVERVLTVAMAFQVDNQAKKK